MRKFPARIGKLAGLHPDMMLAPGLQEDDAEGPLIRPAGQRSSKVTVHPDLDWDLVSLDPQSISTLDPDPDPIDSAISIEDLHEEQVPREGHSDYPERDAPPSIEPELDFDWQFETEWSGVAGDASSAEPSSDTWEPFDFDIADLGPDPEAEAEETFREVETPEIRNRRLDGAAASLVLALGAFRVSDRGTLHRQFRKVLEEFPHPASHAALHRLLHQGVSLEEIEEATQLRCIWRDQPWLWAEKRSSLASWSVRRTPTQRLAFGWPTAVRLVRTFGIVESERSIVEDWFDTWVCLERRNAVSQSEEMAFFTYSGFLRQLPPNRFENETWTDHEDDIDDQRTLEIRDNRGMLIWKFSEKSPPRHGEMSLEPFRIRNHRAFENDASDSEYGLLGLLAMSEIEYANSRARRTYRFPAKPFVGSEGARARVSSPFCHGSCTIVGLDREASLITLSVPEDQRRLLDQQISLIAEPSSAQRVVAAKHSAKLRTKNENEDEDL